MNINRPLLQYWAMIIHPPILYVGFIGFLVPFAFAIAALATKQLGDTWIRTTRRWTLLTWLMLGAGLILSSLLGPFAIAAAVRIAYE